MFAQVFPLFQDASRFTTVTSVYGQGGIAAAMGSSMPTIAEPTAQGIIYVLSFAVNVFVFAYILKRAKVQKKNPWKNEIFTRFLEKLGHALIESNIKPEIEIFDAGMIYNAIYYMKKGVLKAPCHFQIVLGCPGGMTNTVENLVFLKSLIPDGSTWAACGIGAGHMPIMMAGIAMGAHIRVGMEDNVMWQKGVPAESNAQFVKRAKELLEMNGLEAATPEEARKIYGLTRKVF